MELRLSVGGDPDGGWLVDIHDGDRNGVYRPGSTYKTAAHAAMAALVEHEGEIPDLSPPTPVVVDPPVPALPAEPPADPVPAAPAETLIERIEDEIKQIV